MLREQAKEGDRAVHLNAVRVQVLAAVMDPVIPRTMAPTLDLEVGVVVAAYQTTVALRTVLGQVWAQTLPPDLKDCLQVPGDILVLVALEAAAVVDKLVMVVDPKVMGPVVVVERVQVIQIYTQEGHIGVDQVL